MFRPIQWARTSSWGRQVEADGSRLLNLYAIAQQHPEDAKVPIPLQSTPGLRRWMQIPKRDIGPVTPQTGIHGLLAVENPLYGTRLFGIAHQYYFFSIELGTDFQAGYQPWGSDTPVSLNPAKVESYTAEAAESVPVSQPIKLTTDGRRVLFVSRNEVLCYDLGRSGGAGFLLLEAPQPSQDLSVIEGLGANEWVDCDWVDGYFLLAARSGQFFHSQLDSVQFDQLDFSSAETNPDEIVAIETMNRRIYILGRETVENWYNAGGADFAFSRDNGFTVEVGAATRGAVVKIVDRICFVGSDGIVYAITGQQTTRISREPVEYDINRSDIDKARAYTYTEEGHRFYCLNLLIDGQWKNWTYDLMMGLWHERSSTNIVCCTRFNDRNIVGLDQSEWLQDLHLDWGTNHDDNGNDVAIYREAVSPVIFANMQRFSIHSFQCDIPERPGDPLDSVLVEWSDDARLTWHGGTNRDGSDKSIPMSGRQRFRVNRLGQGRTGRNIRLSTSAKRRVDILGAYIETDVSDD